jgi:hypothetical protein
MSEQTELGLDGTPAPTRRARPVLTLEEAGHTYRLDGVAVPSVTQVLEAAGLGVDYSAVAPSVLRHARERGLHIDRCCDLYDENDLDWRSVHPEAQPYVEAWARFRQAEGYQPQASQPRLYHPDYGYAGTPDTVGMVGREWAVLDRKATTKLSVTYGCQLGGYAVPGLYVAEEAGEIAPVPWPTPARAVVWLKPDASYQVVPYQSADDVAAFLGALALWRWRQARQLSGVPRGRRVG